MSGHLTREEKNIWKEDLIRSRYQEYVKVIDYMKTNNIIYEQYDSNSVEVADVSKEPIYTMILYSNMKVKFVGTKKKVSI